MTQKRPERRPTLADVAARAGVSRSLVSLAIRGEGHVRAESRERIARAAAELNYQPNLAARTLASAEARHIGIVVGDVTNPLQAEIAKWASLLLGDRSFTGLVSLDADTDENACRAVRALAAQRVSGVLLIGAPYEKAAIARVAAELPAVYIGRLLKIVNIDSVTTDHILGAKMAVEYLSTLNRRRITHVDGGASPGAERMRQGYCNAMRALGLEAEIRVLSGAYSIDAGAAAGRALFGSSADLPEAIFACSDLAAIGILNEAAKHGISIPRDLLLVGYDDITLAGTETLSLTSIRQSARDLAEAGVAALARRLKHPDAATTKTLVPPTLIARRSSEHFA